PLMDGPPYALRATPPAARSGVNPSLAACPSIGAFRFVAHSRLRVRLRLRPFSRSDPELHSPRMSDSALGTALDRAATMAEVGERGLVRHLRSRIPVRPGVLVGVGDDAAAVETGALTRVTTNVIVEGVHFQRD